MELEADVKLEAEQKLETMASVVEGAKMYHSLGLD